MIITQQNEVRAVREIAQRQAYQLEQAKAELDAAQWIINRKQDELDRANLELWKAQQANQGLHEELKRTRGAVLQLQAELLQQKKRQANEQ